MYIHTYVKGMYICERKCVNVKLGEATKRNVWKKHSAKYINMYVHACIYIRTYIRLSICILIFETDIHTPCLISYIHRYVCSY